MTDLPTHILIVEDEADIRRFVRLTLESEGHTVHEAATLQRGLIEAGTRRPGLVVLDPGLPDGDGVDLIRDLRTWSAMPVIMLSPSSAEARTKPRTMCACTWPTCARRWNSMPPCPSICGPRRASGTVSCLEHSYPFAFKNMKP